MTIEICAGCGRRAAEEEVVCAACGRALRDAKLEEHPPGWETMPDVAPPSLRPLRQDERPPAGSPTDGASEESATDLFMVHPAADGAATPSGDAGNGEGGSAGQGAVAGGRGWRVRVSANQGAAGTSAPTPMAAATLSGASDVVAHRGVPQWIYPLLILSIVATSTAAVVLVVLHVLRSSS